MFLHFPRRRWQKKWVINVRWDSSHVRFIPNDLVNVSLLKTRTCPCSFWKELLISCCTFWCPERPRSLWRRQRDDYTWWMYDIANYDHNYGSTPEPPVIQWKWRSALWTSKTLESTGGGEISNSFADRFLWWWDQVFYHIQTQPINISTVC